MIKELSVYFIVFFGFMIFVPWIVFMLTKDLSADIVAVPLSGVLIVVWFIRKIKGLEGAG